MRLISGESNTAKFIEIDHDTQQVISVVLNNLIDIKMIFYKNLS